MRDETQELVFKIWQLVSGDRSSYCTALEPEAVALLEAFRAATLKEAANRMCMVCEGHYELTLCGGTRDKPYRPEHCMFRAAIEGVQK